MIRLIDNLWSDSKLWKCEWIKMSLSHFSESWSLLSLQYGHTKGRSPVWVMRCFLYAMTVLKVDLQTSHCLTRLPSCTFWGIYALVCVDQHDNMFGKCSKWQLPKSKVSSSSYTLSRPFRCTHLLVMPQVPDQLEAHSAPLADELSWRVRVYGDHVLLEVVEVHEGGVALGTLPHWFGALCPLASFAYGEINIICRSAIDLSTSSIRLRYIIIQ